MNILDLQKLVNLLQYMVPGVYQIECLANSTVYIGISQNILERFGKHSATLAANNHDSQALQKDWNRWGQNKFTFTVLSSGPEWALKEDREIEEQRLIKQKVEEESYKVYNIDPKVLHVGNYRRSVSVDGVIYKTIGEAVRASKGVLKDTTVRRRLRSTKHPTYFEVSRNTPSYSVDGVQFDSQYEIVAAGLAKNLLTVKRRLKNENFPTGITLEDRYGNTYNDQASDDQTSCSARLSTSK